MVLLLPVHHHTQPVLRLCAGRHGLTLTRESCHHWLYHECLVTHSKTLITVAHLEIGLHTLKLENRRENYLPPKIMS